MTKKLAWMLLAAALGEPTTVLATTVTGRITLGTYDGKETVSQASQGNYSNDVATASGRFYLRAADITDNRFELISDVRDKHDFFGLDDKQAFQLTDKNTLQVRQLSAFYPGKTFFTRLGRFPVPEAGAVYTDGALQGVNLGSNFKWAAFGGLNPKRPEQTYVQWNSESQVYGTYLTYTPGYQSWDKSFFINLAGVTDIVQNLTDRTYVYTNLLYQWNRTGRLFLLSYLDFVPSQYLQNGTVNFEQGLGPKLVLALNYFAIDVIEYIHLQSVRSLLPSSPYKESSGKLRLNATDRWNLDVSYANGFREADGLNRQEVMLTSNWLRIFSPHWDFNISGGYRDSFVSYDTFGGLNVNYFSTLWEIGLNEEMGIEYYKTGFGTYHPLTSELSISRAFDNALYGTFSLQDVHDERVQITTVFFKMSYRFGRKEFPPVRDGAPPRGRL